MEVMGGLQIWIHWKELRNRSNIQLYNLKGLIPLSVEKRPVNYESLPFLTFFLRY